MRAAAPETIPTPALLRELGALGYGGHLRSLQALMKLHKIVGKPALSCGLKPIRGARCNATALFRRRGAHPRYAFTATLGSSRWR